MKKIIAFILSAILCFSFPFVSYGEENNELAIDDVKSEILMCMDTGDIVFEKNSNERLSPASVTKIMSILLTVEAIDSGKISLDSEVSASETAVAMGGSQIWLEVGEVMTVDELLKAVVVASANDACTALGEFIAGSDSGFVNMMNEKAKKLGLKDTHFENCTGLDDDIKEHYSSAHDLAVIASEVMKHKIVQNYSKIWLDYLRDGKTELNNTNKLINKYNGMTGLKTGTTSNAGFCLCATATRENTSFVAVVLGGKTSEARFSSASKLLDYGFANYEVLTPEIDESKITDVKIKCGTEKSISPKIDETSKVMLKKGSENLQYTYEIKEELTAPIECGDDLGCVIVKSGGKEVGKIKLLSSVEVDKTSFMYIFKQMLSNI